MVGLALSVTGLILVGIVDQWGDAPGLGFLLLGVACMGAIAGFASGSYASVPLWKSHDAVHLLKVVKLATWRSFLYLASFSLAIAGVVAAWVNLRATPYSVVGRGLAITLFGGTVWLLRAGLHAGE